ncbi:fluoride efflux transporter FluC [Microbacterium luticocti]|uniref:fluoride efflux transporter FluC n=1 Tax=Microbacterium luticocti TaxID=451764 RepID=UPI000409D461|nr:CrcB family protein [Microbacterium luticocti]
MTLVEHQRDNRRRHHRPVALHPKLILFVFVGGAVGTAIRAVLAFAFPWTGTVPWTILVVNLCGALVLGFLLTALAVRTPETDARRDVRLFAGTGIMGGFTTYSELASDSAVIFGTDPVLAISFALLTVLGGVACAGIGVIAAKALVHRRVDLSTVHA